MTTSGTTAFSPNVLEIMEEAASRAGFELRSGYQWDSASRSMNFLTSEWANRGINLWMIDSGTISLVANDAQYDFPADTVDVIRFVVRDDSSTDYYLERIGVGTYAQIHNKTQTGRPLQGWVERLVDFPRINLWPVPDRAYTLVYWRLRRIQDAGTPLNTMDLPFRFLHAFTAGLAYQLALKNPELPMDRLTALKLMYEEELQRAQSEDRGRESFFIGLWNRRPGR
jgi:hypothetical protein